MSRSSTARFVLLLTLVLAGAALARKPQQFEAPREMTEEELQRSKELSKSNLNGWGKDISVNTRDVPWRTIGLFAIVFLVVSPFAARMFRDTSKEISGANAFGSRGRQQQNQEE